MRISDWSSDVCSSDLRSTYAGPAYECAVRLEPIAGYRHGDDADTRAVEEHVTRLWLTRPPDVDVWIPVQIDSGISLGIVTVWIAGATLNGKTRSEEQQSELQSLMRISYAAFWLTKK